LGLKDYVTMKLHDYETIRLPDYGPNRV
jgi:hypothetical protein